MLQPPVTIPIAFVLGMLSGIRARPGEALVDVDKALKTRALPRHCSMKPVPASRPSSTWRYSPC